MTASVASPVRKPALAGPTFLAAVKDPNLFGPHFRAKTWRAWLAFGSALFGLPMDDDALALFREHTGRTTPPTAAFKEAALICGRRGGKSRVLALIATYLATCRDYAPFLAAGERATVAIIAADRRQARSILRYIEGFIDSIPMMAGLVRERTTESLTLVNRVVIEIHTASFRVTRGYTLVAALCDEVAFWRSDDSANPDVEILKALRPGLGTIPGAMLLVASSPYSRRGVLYSMFRKHYGQDGAPVLVWRGSTAEMNPGIDPDIIAEAYADDPASAAAEYGAEFRDDIASFVAREVIDGVTVPGRYEVPHISAHRYVAFTDPSGGSSDSMTLAVAHREGELAVLDVVREFRPPFSPEAVVTEMAALLKAYGLREVTGDRYGGEWPRERFKVHGITYNLADKPKSDLYRDLLPMLNSGKVELLDLPRLHAQLCGLERRTARGGRDSIDHAPAAHDDIANAVAGALLKVGGKSSGEDVLRRFRSYVSTNLTSPVGAIR